MPDPRERKDFATLLAEWLRERAKECAELQSTNSKLAAEIAELKAWKESAMSVMPPYQEIGEALGLTIGQSIHDKILPGIGALMAELEAARKERDAVEKLKEMAHSAAVTWQQRAETYHEAVQRTEGERDTALAAKDAAENQNKEFRHHVEYVLSFSKHWPCYCDDERTCQPCEAEKELRALLALTPAPTQEPPAGGVTISTSQTEQLSGTDRNMPGKPNEITALASGPIVIMGEPYDPTKFDSVPVHTSPADVPSEGRGELLPFNLSDALAGKPVVTRDGRAITGISQDFGQNCIRGYDFGVLRRWMRDGKWYIGDTDSPLDLFMLPTEGSGA